MRCCETCSNVPCKILDRVPCSNQSERDKVLSLIRCFIEHEGFNCREADAIKEYMEELRQQAGDRE
jgi:hypothetical protein